jgi:toxin ParE1/3/4
MAKIIWSNFALQDLEEIYTYTSKFSKAYACRLTDKIIERLDILESQPQMGRIVPEFNNQNLRELIEGNYRIIYQIEIGNIISIVRIHHSTRLLTNI